MAPMNKHLYSVGKKSELRKNKEHYGRTNTKHSPRRKQSDFFDPIGRSNRDCVVTQGAPMERCEGGRDLLAGEACSCNAYANGTFIPTETKCLPLFPEKQRNGGIKLPPGSE
ncbi:hypothetical protein NPIL_676421 [Nephila pilipes]|uniref:Uncharacterized protein n=1 Tax=Nephila pilipes TaxID=299642 RepID=A0A8X6NH60_NEPPI|nr:hypothetical protein NPIL_676421 [Nephila pilipes]